MLLPVPTWIWSHSSVKNRTLSSHSSQASPLRARWPRPKTSNGWSSLEIYRQQIPKYQRWWKNKSVTKTISQKASSYSLVHFSLPKKERPLPLWKFDVACYNQHTRELISTQNMWHGYLWLSLCALYLHACQVRVTAGNSGLCCCTCVMYFECQLTPLCVDSAWALWASFSFRFVVFHSVFLNTHWSGVLTVLFVVTERCEVTAFTCPGWSPALAGWSEGEGGRWGSLTTPWPHCPGCKTWCRRLLPQGLPLPELNISSTCSVWTGSLLQNSQTILNLFPNFTAKWLLMADTKCKHHVHNLKESNSCHLWQMTHWSEPGQEGFWVKQLVSKELGVLCPVNHYGLIRVKLNN